MNSLYYHTPSIIDVYICNIVRCWVKYINLLDYDYVFIPSNSNKLHWVLLIIVPSERRIGCYDSLYEADGSHYNSLSVIIRFIKDDQVLNKLPVDNWMWWVRVVCEPKQNSLIDRGIFVCMWMYCMMKGRDLNSIPADAHNSRLWLFIAYSILKWDKGTEDY
jgi:Ulp1 family protease